MPDIDLEIGFNEAPLMAGLARTTEAASKLAEGAQEVNAEFKKLAQAPAQAAQGLSEALEETAMQSAAVSAETARQTRLQELAEKSWRKAAGSVSLFGVSLENVIDRLRKTKAATAQAETGVGGLGKGWKILNAALKVSIIGVIIAALVTLYSVLTRNQKVVNFFQAAWAGLSAAVEVVFRGLSNVGAVAEKVGSIVSKVFRGQFRAAYAEATTAVSGLVNEMQKEFNLAVALEQKRRQIAQDENRLSLQRAATVRQLQELNRLAESGTATYAARATAIRQAADLEKQINDQAAANARRTVETALKIVADTTGEVDRLLADAAAGAVDLTALAEKIGGEANVEGLVDAVSTLTELDARTAEIDADRQIRLAALNKDRSDQAKAARQELEKLRGEYNKLLTDLSNRAENIELESLTGIERLEKEKEIAQRVTGEFVAAIEAQARRIGTEVSQETREQIRVLFGAIDQEFEAGIKALRANDGILNPLEISKIPKTDFAKAGQDFVAKLKEGIDSADTSGGGNLFENLRLDLMAAFDLSAEDVEFIKGQFSNIFSNLTEIITTQTDLQISEQERLLKAVTGNIGELEKSYAEQLDLQRQGLANSAETVRKQLDQERATRETHEKKLLELRAKAARQQAIQDAAAQVSSLATGAANFFASGAKLGPIVGLALAVGAITSMLALFARFKAAAAKAAEVPEFEEGGIISDGLLIGPSHREGGIDMSYKDRAGRRRLVNAEGGEFITNADATAEFLPFLTGLNRGDTFAEALASLYRPSPITSARTKGLNELQGKKAEIDRMETQRIMTDAVAQAIGRLEGGILETAEATKQLADRPDRIATPDGYLEVTDTKGGTKRKRIHFDK